MASFIVSTAAQVNAQIAALGTSIKFATARSVHEYGAVGDGVTDDRAAIVAALANNNIVSFSDAAYAISAPIDLASNKVLVGLEAIRYYSGDASNVRGTRLNATAGFTGAYLIGMQSRSAMRDLLVNASGVATGVRNIATSGIGGNLTRVVIYGATGSGFNGNGRGSTIESCWLQDNGVGLKQLVDSRVIGCYINENGIGIQQGNGSGNVMIVGNSIEFNTDDGIQLYQSNTHAIVGNIIDRNGKAGIRVGSSGLISISGNVLKRNGKNSSGTASGDCQIALSYNIGQVSITGNTTGVGAEDDGSGYTSPAYALYREGNSGDLIIAGNGFRGFVTSVQSIPTPDTGTATFSGNAGLTDTGSSSGGGGVVIDDSSTSTSKVWSSSKVSSTLAGKAAPADISAAIANFVGPTQAAKNPDLLIVGSINRDVNEVITTAAVVWPDGTPGTFTTLAVDATGAVNRYSITYGSPVTKTYTQPTITRDASGAAINVPQITVA
jgi:parallel beta-helix repeat protein